MSILRNYSKNNKLNLKKDGKKLMQIKAEISGKEQKRIGRINKYKYWFFVKTNKSIVSMINGGKSRQDKELEKDITVDIDKIKRDTIRSYIFEKLKEIDDSLTKYNFNKIYPMRSTKSKLMKWKVFK